LPESDAAAERHLVAVVSDEPEHYRAIRDHLGDTFRISHARNEDEIQKVFENADVHAVLFDLDCVGDGAADGLEVLEEMRRLREDLVLAAFTRTTQRTLPLKSAQAGADELFLVPLNFEELKIVLLRAMGKRALELEGRRVIAQAEQKVSFCGLVGGSAAMQKVYGSVEAVANTNASVLIRGESGVGKELIARAVVQCSERAGEAYICLNCSALPENLIESELFGYEKGAFTGADGAKPGLIELAHGGTLFLDEITTLNPHLQSKLLRVLQERTSQRLGARHAQKIDFRLITATNEDLEDCVRKGRFREDLYFRINVVPIIVPPLRERDGDIALLLDHFLRIYCTSAKKPLKTLKPDVVELLEDYKWPGNVRELENVVQRLVVMVASQTVTLEHLPQQMLQSSAAGQESMLIPEEGVEFDAELERIELAYINAALRRTGGKKSAAAALLKVDPQRMKYLCRKHKIQ
jgi:two-component system response regulator PilR (NtrC family)